MNTKCSELLFPLAEVPEFLLRLRAGRKLHKATPRRWANRGVAGIRLRTLCVGGALCTSERFLLEFFERLTALKNPDETARPETSKVPPRMPSEDVAKRLEEIGF